MKTSELIGPALDWAVTTIEEPEALRYGIEDWKEQRRHKVVEGHYTHRYHQVWQQGGPIIERERIELHEDEGTSWAAFMWNGGVCKFGPTPLVAAMRCYVASKLGDEVDVPEELL